MSAQNKIHGRTRLLLWWPLFLIPVFLVIAGIANHKEEWSVATAIICLGLYAAFTLWWIIYWRKKLEESMRFFAQEYQEIQTDQLEQLPLPGVLVDDDGKIFWSNEAFNSIRPNESLNSIEQLSGDVADYAQGFWRGVDADKEYFRTSIDGAEYHIIFRFAGDFLSIWFCDKSEYYEKVQIIDNMQPVVAQVCFDNYEEVMSEAEEVKRPLIAAIVERTVSQYFKQYGAVVNAVEKDKYTANLNNEALKKIQADKFSILEDVKKVNIGNDRVQPTISIGVGAEGSDLEENAKYSKAAMALCLGRGGDQAVIRRPKGSSFYGGKTEKTEKSTRVRARIVARALRDFLSSKERVLIMGHAIPDADSIGAAIGMYKIARIVGKEARIIMDAVPSSIKPIYDNIIANTPVDEKIFVKKSEVKDFYVPGTALVVVDVNRPAITEYPEIISKIESIVVIDHHRQGEDTIEKTSLSYIEPYASSASELVAEILQYISEDVKLSEAEAEALYAGIIIDTDNFLAKTGARTFEAAAFLKRQGANMAHVRKFFRESMKEFKAKSMAVSTVDVYGDAYAFGKCEATGLESPTIIGAQAANELLDIKGVKASFVFTPFANKIFISARSIDEINVQLVMERLGGGGHLSVAGAQLSDVTIDEAIEKTKQVLDMMIKEGEI